MPHDVPVEILIPLSLTVPGVALPGRTDIPALPGDMPMVDAGPDETRVAAIEITNNR